MSLNPLSLSVLFESLPLAPYLDSETRCIDWMRIFHLYRERDRERDAFSLPTPLGDPFALQLMLLIYCFTTVNAVNLFRQVYTSNGIAPVCSNIDQIHRYRRFRCIIITE